MNKLILLLKPLATRSYVSLVKEVKAKGYTVTLIFLWLPSVDIAKMRVAKRGAQGGHNILPEVIERRYYRGIYNLTNLYIPVCDKWIIADNNNFLPATIATSYYNEKTIYISDLWKLIFTAKPIK